MSRAGASRQFINVVCSACGKDDEWEGFEDVVRVTGQEGHAPEIGTIGGGVCGQQQERTR